MRADNHGIMRFERGKTANLPTFIWVAECVKLINNKISTECLKLIIYHITIGTAKINHIFMFFSFAIKF